MCRLGRSWHAASPDEMFLLSHLATGRCYLKTVKQKKKIHVFSTFFVTFTGKTRTKEKYRVVYTDHQRLELEKEFHFNRYITIRRKSELAVNLGLSERQVCITKYIHRRIINHTREPET